jgi:hypothetical protein
MSAVIPDHITLASSRAELRDDDDDRLFFRGLVYAALFGSLAWASILVIALTLWK